MSNNKLAVIDWETLDTKPTAMVLSLGVTFFDPSVIDTWDTLEKQSLYQVYNLNSELNRTISPDTVMWWVEQDNKAIEAITDLKEERISLSEGMLELSNWLSTNKVSNLIGNGSSFDNTILDNIYAQLKLMPPLSFWTHMDLRTAKWLYGQKTNQPTSVPRPKSMIPHNAKHDAIYEAMCFQTYYKGLINNE